MGNSSLFAGFEALTSLPEAFIDALPTLVACFDTQGRFVFVNRAYQEWFGRTLEEVRGRTLREVSGEIAHQRVQEHVAKVLGGEEAEFEATIRNRLGAPRWIRGRYLPARNGKGEVVGFYALIDDRTEAEQNLRLERMLNGISDGFCTFDEFWRLTYCNQAAEEHWGADRVASLGKTYLDLAPAVAETPLDAALKDFSQTAPRLDIETEDISPGRVLAISVFPLERSFAIISRDVTFRNAAIRRAREQEQRLELAMEASGFGDWSWDAATDVVTLSSRAAAIFGVQEGPVMTWTEMLDLLHEDDREKARLGSERALAEQANLEIEYRLRRPGGGDWLWALAIGQATYDQDGAVKSMTGLVGDISKSKAGEAALRESEARFRAMAEAAPAPVWVTSATGEMVFANQAFLDQAGRPADELMGFGWHSLVHPEDAPEVAARRAAAWERLEPYSWEARILEGDGRTKIVHGSCQPWFDSAGTFRGYVGIANDLTEMRRAEAALRESEQRFRLVAEDAPVMLWMSDETGACEFLNRALREFLGLPEDFGTFDLRTALVPEDVARFEDVYLPAVERHEAFSVEARYRRADGEIRTVATRAKPRFESDGRFVGMIGVNADVTDARRFQTRQQLLINELNHRVKNTLATVHSMARQTLQIDRVTREAREQFTSRLLALSAAHNVLTRQSWDGAPMLEIVAEAIRPYEDAGQPRVTLKGPAVRLSPSVALALSMALHELATNALKYGAFSTPAGRVSLSWDLSLDDSRISVEWREEDGPPVVEPTRPGFGSRLLRQGLAIELGAPAEIEYAPTGVVCRFRAPIQSALAPDPIA